MSVTFTKAGDGYNVEGAIPVQVGDLALDNSYPTGGYALTGANFGLRSLAGLQILGIKGTLANSGSLLPWFDLTNGKLMMFYPSGGGAASPAALSAPAVAAGGTGMTSAAASGTADLVPGQGKQVANATDLSTITLTVKAISGR